MTTERPLLRLVVDHGKRVPAEAGDNLVSLAEMRSLVKFRLRSGTRYAPEAKESPPCNKPS